MIIHDFFAKHRFLQVFQALNVSNSNCMTVQIFQALWQTCHNFLNTTLHDTNILVCYSVRQWFGSWISIPIKIDFTVSNIAVITLYYCNVEFIVSSKLLLFIVSSKLLLFIVSSKLLLFIASCKLLLFIVSSKLLLSLRHSQCFR